MEKYQWNCISINGDTCVIKVENGRGTSATKLCGFKRIQTYDLFLTDATVTVQTVIIFKRATQNRGEGPDQNLWL